MFIQKKYPTKCSRSRKVFAWLPIATYDVHGRLNKFAWFSFVTVHEEYESRYEGARALPPRWYVKDMNV